jgi:tetratricopeptide (TPR) repeat protein
LRKKLAEKGSSAPDGETAERRRSAQLASAEMRIVQAVAGGLLEGEAFGPAEAWLEQRGLPLIEKMPQDLRQDNRIALWLLQGEGYLLDGRRQKDRARRAELLDRSIRVYSDIWKASRGNVVAGNNLAMLLLKEKDNPTGALAVIEEVKTGRYSRKPISGERLPLEVLDTLGQCYRAADRHEDAVKLFKEAELRYSNEPRVLLHLGHALAALRQNKEAHLKLYAAIEKAETRLKTTNDPVRQAALKELITEARAEHRKVSAGSPTTGR